MYGDFVPGLVIESHLNRPGEESKDDAETIGSLRGDDQELYTGCCIL